MRGSVLLVLAALGVSTVGSVLLWVAPRLFRRRPPSFREQLAAVSPRPGRRVGPAGGVASLAPLHADPALDSPGPPDAEDHDPAAQAPPESDTDGPDPPMAQAPAPADWER